MRIALAVVTLLGSGCVGEIGSSGDGSGEIPDAAAESAVDRLWREGAAPVMTARCKDCHATAQPGYLFLAGATDAEMRATLLASNYVNLETITSSRIVTKGLHLGPELKPDELSAVLAWLTAEQDPTPTDEVLKTAPITVTNCATGALADCVPNTISLAAVGTAGLDATITFKAPTLTGMLYMNELTIHGGTTGAYLEHPLFVSVPAAGDTTGTLLADNIDRYFDTKINVKPGEDLVIEGGTAAFGGFPTTNQLILSFKVVGAYKPETVVPPTGGCKALAAFKTSARTPFQTSCNSCHGGGQANAKAAMDLTGIASADDAVLAVACGQILTRVNKTTPAMSGVFLAPTPGNANHPFTFGGNQANFTAFRTAVTTWITAEQVAP